MKKYPKPTNVVSRPGTSRLSWRRPGERQSIGTKDGSIIATVITTHMPRNDSTAAGIDIVQSLGIAIAGMDTQQTIVRSSTSRRRRRAAPKC
jgi:hypothetical protein